VEGYTWQQAGGRRHGRIGLATSTLPAGRVFRTLCGRELTVSEQDDRTRDGVVWLAPTCSACDYKMRRAGNAPAHDPDYVAALDAANRELTFR
jgi:hypothetical protein